MWNAEIMDRRERDKQECLDDCPYCSSRPIVNIRNKFKAFCPNNCKDMSVETKKDLDLTLEWNGLARETKKNLSNNPV